jgi:hypothetical protein
MKFILLALIFSDICFAIANCKNTLVIGDSQLGWGVDEISVSGPQIKLEIDHLPYKSLGIIMFEKFKKDCPNNRIHIFAQGSSGVDHWLDRINKFVPYLGGNRFKLSSHEAYIRKRGVEIPYNEYSKANIPSLKSLMRILKPKRVIVALSANDWKKSETDTTILYRELLSEIKASSTECFVQGVAGIKEESSQGFKYPHLVRAVKQAARLENCVFVDMSIIEPTGRDGVHYYGDSTLRAFNHFFKFL